MITIDGVRPSADIRQELANLAEETLLAFSCGKDSIAAWLALLDSGVRVRPYYMYPFPGLKFVEDSLEYFEGVFGVRIARYPHVSLYRMINHFVLQSPERLSTIEAARLPIPRYDELLGLIRQDLDCADSWVADGVRAADSIVRRASIARHGPMKLRHRKVSVVWDWQKREVMGRIAEAGIKLPVDYEWFGRSFDGIDYRFLEPIARNAPEDYQRILEWVPLAELELIRPTLAVA